MRFLSAAIAAGLVAATASAQQMQPKAVPAQRAATMPGLPDMPRISVLPRPRTTQQRAAAIQKLLSLPTPPTLGETASLTPGSPTVPRKAEFVMTEVVSILGGNLWNSSVPASGGAVLSARSHVFVTIAAGPGMRYALDCRIDPDARAIDYGDISSSPDGRVPVSADGHFLIALEKTSSATKLIVSMAPLGIGQYLFYGCEISPF